MAEELRKEKQSALETRLRIRQEIAEERALRYGYHCCPTFLRVLR